MLQGIFHVNIVVEDLDRTLAFYCDVLGFSVVYGEVTTDDSHHRQRFWLRRERSHALGAHTPR